jgi:hypothetical protein
MVASPLRELGKACERWEQQDEVCAGGCPRQHTMLREDEATLNSTAPGVEVAGPQQQTMPDAATLHGPRQHIMRRAGGWLMPWVLPRGGAEELARKFGAKLAALDEQQQQQQQEQQRKLESANKANDDMLSWGGGELDCNTIDAEEESTQITHA